MKILLFVLGYILFFFIFTFYEKKPDYPIQSIENTYIINEYSNRHHAIDIISVVDGVFRGCNK